MKACGRWALRAMRFAIGDVGDDHLGRFEGREELVDIDGALLVFRVELGVVHLADVVVEGRGAAKEAVGADRLGAGFGEIAEDEAMLVGAGHFHGKSSEELAARIHVLHEGHVGEDAEERLEGGQDADDENGCDEEKDERGADVDEKRVARRGDFR